MVRVSSEGRDRPPRRNFRSIRVLRSKHTTTKKGKKMNEHESPTPQSQAQTQAAVPCPSAADLRYWAGRGLIAHGLQANEPERAQLGTSLLQVAAGMGSTAAKRDLAQIHLVGLFGHEVDREKGLALLKDAVADGDAEAEMELAKAIYWKNPPSDADVLWDAATVLWRDRADYKTAFLLMSRAARMNHVPAMRDYAQMLREGIGCEKDPHLAADIEWQADLINKKGSSK